MMLTPGVAWDGYARPLVALAPQRLGLELFADCRTPRRRPCAGRGVAHLSRASRQPPGVGSLSRRRAHSTASSSRTASSCGPRRVADYHSVTIASRAIEATEALITFDPAEAALRRVSAAQTFPDSGSTHAGPSSSASCAGESSRAARTLIKRTDDDRNTTRAARRYLGAVAETIVPPTVCCGCGIAGRIRRTRRSTSGHRSCRRRRNDADQRSGLVRGTPARRRRCAPAGRAARLSRRRRRRRRRADGRLRRTTDAVLTREGGLDAFIGAPPPLPPNGETRFG